MEKFIILPDITCDLSKEVRDFFGLQDYVKGYVCIEDESVNTDLDWQSISRERFYKTLMNKKISVTSSASSPEEYYQIFKKYVDDGYAVLSMSLSSKISATYNITKSAQERLLKENPQAKVYCLDTLRMSGSFGLLVIYALLLQKEGKNYDEVIEWLESNKTRVHQMGPIDDLTFIARRGRISNGKAIMANLVGIKPMGDSNADGYVSVLAKAKGIKKALNATALYLKKIATDIENQYLLIAHSDREQLALELKKIIESTVKCKGVFVTDVYASCGTNIGPGMIGVNFLGDHVSIDSSYEKQALLDALAEC